MVEFIQLHWVEITVIAIALHTFLKAVRDAIDKTPQTDDNWFERLVTVLGKAVSYLAGSRAK